MYRENHLRHTLIILFCLCEIRSHRVSVRVFIYLGFIFKRHHFNILRAWERAIIHSLRECIWLLPSRILKVSGVRTHLFFFHIPRLRSRFQWNRYSVYWMLVAFVKKCLPKNGFQKTKKKNMIRTLRKPKEKFALSSCRWRWMKKEKLNWNAFMPNLRKRKHMQMRALQCQRYSCRTSEAKVKRSLD